MASSASWRVACFFCAIWEEEDKKQPRFRADEGGNTPEAEKETQQAVLSFYKDMEMPARRVAGRRYIGILEIGALRLKLPVLDTFSYRNIKVAPARFFGSVYDDNLILLAHNYQSHFGKLHLLQTGDEVSFTEGGREPVTNFLFHGMINGGKILVSGAEPPPLEISGYKGRKDRHF